MLRYHNFIPNPPICRGGGVLRFRNWLLKGGVGKRAAVSNARDQCSFEIVVLVWLMLLKSNTEKCVLKSSSLQCSQLLTEILFSCLAFIGMHFS